MQIALICITVVAICCFTEAQAKEARADVALEQAQRDFNEADKLDDAGKFAEAAVLAERALELWERELGQEHLKVADCLNLLGDLYQKQGYLTKAEPLLLRSLRIREAALGESHLAVAESLNSLGSFHLRNGSYQQAEPLLLRSLRIQEAHGKNHLGVASSLNSLGSLYREQGLYKQAEELFQRALEIREAALGKNHSSVATSLNNLALTYKLQGRFDLAEPLYLRSLAVREAALGKHHPAVAQVLNNLALLYTDQGWNERAEPLYRRSLTIREATLGKHHVDVAQSLNNLAAIYMDQGLYEQAESLLQRALHIVDEALVQSHPSVATVLHNLAKLYQTQGLYDRAEPLHRRSVQIWETVLGQNHTYVAASLINLAQLYWLQGLPERAESLLERAQQIRELTLGRDHPDLAIPLHELATLYTNRGLYEKAEPLYQRALQLREAVLGQNHPDVATSLNGLGQLYLAQNRLASAWPLLERAFSIVETRLRREALGFSESRLAAFLTLLHQGDQTLYNLVHEHPSEMAARRLGLLAALLHKGRSLAEITDISRAIYRNLGPADRETFQRLRALQTQRAELSLKGPGKLLPATYRARLEELETQADAVEAELAQRSAPLRAQRQLHNPTDVIGRVAATLPPDGALVEIIAFEASPVVPPPNTPPAKVASIPSYLALVLLPTGDIHVADLGLAEVIDGAVRRLLLGLSSPYADFLLAAQELHRLVIKPLAHLLVGQRRLFISPDGQLNLVPFVALHDGTHFLADTYDISFLTSGKDLLRHIETPTPPRAVVVFADPDFGTAAPVPTAQRGETAFFTPSSSSILERSPLLERFFDAARTGLANESWPPLPGTRAEAKAIRKILPEARLFLGRAATKRALLGVPPPRILHVATHGFFTGHDVALPGTRGKSGLGTPSDKGTVLLPSDPLLRAGLVLAQTPAQRAVGDDAARSHAQNTLVTALELAGMNLWGTGLVVLSACDTGRGEIKRGQGVYGLRRALIVAGTETIVTSLWKVRDGTTHEFMKTFYEEIKAGRGRAQALGEAMRQMRAQHPHPYYWAPFILTGNDAPLRGIQASWPPR